MTVYENVKYVIRAVKQWKLKLKIKRYQFLKDIQVDFNDIKPNKLPDKPPEKMSIAFVIPGLPAFSGGHTSILRLGTYLSEFGYDIYYVSYRYASQESMERNARSNLSYYKGIVLDRSHLRDEFDIGIASSWESAYVIYNLKNFIFNAYFIQDYEPYFYQYGDEYILARNSYRLGHKMISLGTWNKSIIEKDINGLNVDAIDFPYEPKQYQVTERKLEIGDVFRLAVYIKDDPKRSPVVLLLALSRLKELLRDNIEINIFGMNKLDALSFANNLGMLSTEQLKSLYARCHLGIVSSMTNISLVPYEMVASGLPIMEFIDGSYTTFFSPQSAVLVETLPFDLCNKIMYLRNHADELNEHLKAAQEELKSRTWENSSRQFAEALFHK